MTNERWAPIPSFSDRYRISTSGRVATVSRTVPSTNQHGSAASRTLPGRMIKVYATRDGKSYVLLYDGQETHRAYINDLLVEAFKLGEPRLPIVDWSAMHARHGP